MPYLIQCLLMRILLRFCFCFDFASASILLLLRFCFCALVYLMETVKNLAWIDVCQWGLARKTALFWVETVQKQAKFENAKVG